MKKVLQTVALLLCLVLLFCSCAAHGKRLMKAGEENISVNVLKLYLSRMRGSLYYAGSEVDSEDFWKKYISSDNTTVADFYTKQVLDGLKQIAAGMILYEECGLSLSKEAKQEIEDWIDSLIEEAGNETKLNSILSAYGANVTTLRDAAIIEEKLTQLKVYLYGENGSLIGDTAKEEYYQATYLRGYQMQLANYYYECDKDGDGRIIYYTDTTYAHIAYDTDGNGVEKSAEKDGKGDDVYVYTESGKPAYDAENGIANYHTDESGNEIIAYYTDEENQVRLQKATDIANACKNDPELFLQFAEDYSDNSEFNTNYAPNGMYFSVGEYTGEDIFSTFATALAKLEVGELAVLQSSNGYYILMRAELNAGAWGNTENERWFSTFLGMTLEYMLQKKTDAYLDKVTVNETLLEGVDITTVGTDLYY